MQADIRRVTFWGPFARAAVGLLIPLLGCGPGCTSVPREPLAAFYCPFTTKPQPVLAPSFGAMVTVRGTVADGSLTHVFRHTGITLILIREVNGRCLSVPVVMPMFVDKGFAKDAQSPVKVGAKLVIRGFEYGFFTGTPVEILRDSKAPIQSTVGLWFENWFFAWRLLEIEEEAKAPQAVR